MAEKKINVMFVCLGNICRSPLAEAIFGNKVRKYGLDTKIGYASSGTAHWHIGDNADPRTLEIAEENRVPMNHTASQLKPEDFDVFDYFIAMDAENLNDIRKKHAALKSRSKIHMMRDFDNNRSGKAVPDPYYGEKEDFQQVFELLDESCSNLIDYLIDENKLK